MSENHVLASACYTAPFFAQRSRHYVVIRDQQDQVLFSLPVALRPALYCRDEYVCMKPQFSTLETVLYHAPSASDAQHLVSILSDALQSVSPLEATVVKWLQKTAISVLIGVTAAMTLIAAFYLSHNAALPPSPMSKKMQLSHVADHPVKVPDVTTLTPQPARAEHLPALQPVPQQAPEIAGPVAPVATAQAKPTDLTAEQRASLQAAMAGNLKKAADRGMFSIPLSSGHARTLYVFADPLCPNCRIFEPGLQAMAGYFNVEIFPVTLVGRDATVRNVVPVLCAPKEARAVLWRNLFDMGAGMLHPDEQAQPQACVTGKDALAINDRALQVYRLPGTPTVIADDGRQVPLTAMKDIPALTAFLNHK